MTVRTSKENREKVSVLTRKLNLGSENHKSYIQDSLFLLYFTGH